MSKTLLVITPGSTSHHDGCYDILVAETGQHLASHWCSHAGYAYSDLYSGRPERIKEWTEKFGELEVKFIDQTDLTPQILMERNHAFYAEENNPKATT